MQWLRQGCLAIGSGILTLNREIRLASNTGSTADATLTTALLSWCATASWCGNSKGSTHSRQALQSDIQPATDQLCTRSVKHFADLAIECSGSKRLAHERDLERLR